MLIELGLAGLVVAGALIVGSKLINGQKQLAPVRAKARRPQR